MVGESSNQIIPNMSKDLTTTQKKILDDEVDGMSDPSDSCGSINSERDPHRIYNYPQKKDAKSKPVVKNPIRV